jgi:hypothetical protein
MNVFGVTHTTPVEVLRRLSAMGIAAKLFDGQPTDSVPLCLSRGQLAMAAQYNPATVLVSGEFLSLYLTATHVFLDGEVRRSKPQADPISVPCDNWHLIRTSAEFKMTATNKAQAFRELMQQAADFCSLLNPLQSQLYRWETANQHPVKNGVVVGLFAGEGPAEMESRLRRCVGMSSDADRIPALLALIYAPKAEPFRKALTKLATFYTSSVKDTDEFEAIPWDDLSQEFGLLPFDLRYSMRLYDAIQQRQQLGAVDEDFSDTALRETWEEIGVEIPQIKILKELSPIYIPPSNFFVYAFLSYLEETPVFKFQEAEVQEVLEVPLSLIYHLPNPPEITELPKSKGYKVPFIDFNDHKIWGATSMILSELNQLLKNV